MILNGKKDHLKLYLLNAIKMNLYSTYLDEIEDRDAGCLTARSRRRRHGNQRLQRCGNRLSFADGCVHIVQKIGRPGGIQIRGLRRIDRHNPGMRVGRPQNRRMPNARDRFEVVDKARIAGQQRGIFLSGIPRTDPAVGCVCAGNGRKPYRLLSATAAEQ